ncbi:hypothetical protein [Actinomadura madurae]|uniref:hypothetical protein n=1 Tax=Actinomadura madurae TaxID=1993 RepID=UPI0020D261F9|nr:hypothetical protein [Actinomadura madurae]MCP9967348.1 hypothetical protein [Actinomadura madurae]MCP9979809.1 hypothetical protein [Actinomadura madurae]
MPSSQRPWSRSRFASKVNSNPDQPDFLPGFGVCRARATIFRSPDRSVIVFTDVQRRRMLTELM